MIHWDLTNVPTAAAQPQRFLPQGLKEEEKIMDDGRNWDLQQTRKPPFQQRRSLSVFSHEDWMNQKQQRKLIETETETRTPPPQQG